MEKKVMWIDSDWDVFKDLVLHHSIKFLWEKGIDSNVIFLNSSNKEEACFLDQVLVTEFMNYYTENRGSLEDGEQKDFLRNKYLEIRNNKNHFYNSIVVPYQKEYNVLDVLNRTKLQDNSVFVLRMDLLAKDREDLVNGIDKDYLSMGLYYVITQILGEKCILFTEASMEEAIKKNWVSIYNKHFNGKSVLKKKKNL